MSLSAMICNVSRVAAVPGRRAVPRRENAVPIAASLNRFTGVRGTSNAARGTVRVSHVPVASSSRRVSCNTPSRVVLANACSDTHEPCAPILGSAEEEHDTHKDDLDDMITMLPLDIRQTLLLHEHRSSLLEVVLDLGRCPEARFSGSIPNQCLRKDAVTENDLRFAESKIGSFGGDNRAGITGTLHRISAIRNRGGKVVGLTCRVGRAVKGHVDMIADLLHAGDESILFLGRPGVGKTTVIRELARVLSDVQGKRVVIIDTSNEIGGDGDVPHPAIGSARRMQVPNPSLQHLVMIEAVENHTPEIVIVDEIGTEQEAAACRTIAERGVTLIGTAHGRLLENLLKNPTLSDLVGGIQSVTLGDDEARARGTQKTIMERQAPATFPILIEMHERNFWIAHNVEESVDEVLAGGRPVVQARRRDERTGQVTVERCVYDPDVAASRAALSKTLGSMGGIMSPTLVLDGGLFGETMSPPTPAPLLVQTQRNNAVRRPAAPAGGAGRSGGPSKLKSAVGASLDSLDDPHALWADNIGRVVDKDLLEAMGAGGYVAGGKLGGVNDGNGNKTGNGKKGKKVKPALRVRSNARRH